MKEKLKRTLVVTALVALGIIVAYGGLLFPALCVGAVAVYMTADESFCVFGYAEDEKEQ